jgi:cyclic pyranopterin phosphate synthase
LIESVREIKADIGIGHVEVISRHPLIGKLAYGLNEAGADVINLSIDTLRPDLHKQITGIDDLDELLEAAEICAATSANCKVNTVVMAGVNDQEIDDLIEFCEKIGVRTLKLLDMIKDLEDGVESYAKRLVSIKGRSLRQLYRPMSPITEALADRAVSIRELHQGDFGHPMKALKMQSGIDVIIKDHKAGSWYGSICTGCGHYPCHDALMALRVTADHRLQFCLLREDIAIDLAPHLAEGNGNLEKAIEDALRVYGDAKLNETEDLNAA